MDKKQLNQEIVLCRALVKRARVCVVRKLLKQIKILRSCKNEELREKKFRKARRLVAEIHVMKTLRPDYVTKFALLTENYVPTGSNTKLKRKRNACAKITKHRDLMAKINAIRNKFINWREELPPMLAPKKKKVEEPVTDEANVEDSPVVVESEQCNDENNAIASEEEHDSESEAEENLPEGEKSDSENEENLSGGEKSDSGNSEPESEPEISKPKTGKGIGKVPIPEVIKSNNVKTVLKTEVSQKKKPEKKGKGKSEEEEKASLAEEEEEENGEAEVEEKIDDPFFIGKKIIVPKLLQKGNENHPENECIRKRVRNEDEEEEERPRKMRNVIDELEEIRQRKDRKMEKTEPRRKQPLTEDELHPSWKAKKMQTTIKPFQGKIIKFD